MTQVELPAPSSPIASRAARPIEWLRAAGLPLFLGERVGGAGAGGLADSIADRPRCGTGTIGGIMNFLNNMMGVVAPVTTSYIVGATGSFVGSFLAASIVLAIGIVAYIFILGRMEPIAGPPAA